MPAESQAAFDIDSELTDEDLFGDATLAKLEAQRAAEIVDEDLDFEGEVEDDEDADNAEFEDEDFEDSDDGDNEVDDEDDEDDDNDDDDDDVDDVDEEDEE